MRQRQESKVMKNENKNQKVVFLLNGDKKKIAEENLGHARMVLRAVGLSLRLALEGKSVTSNGLHGTLDVACGLLNESSCFPVSGDGFCDGHTLVSIAIEVNYIYDKLFKRGSRKTKVYILDAMRHFLRFAELAGVDFYDLEAVERRYKKQEKELKTEAVA